MTEPVTGVVVDAPVETATIVADPVTDDAPVVEFKAITLDSQEATDNFVKDRVARATRSAEKKAEAEKQALKDRIAEFENEKLTEDQKKEQRAIAAEKLAQERGEELTKLQRAGIVRDLADEAGLPKALWGRVHGDTEEEIAADIKELIDGLPAAPVVPGRPPTQSPTVRVQPVNSDPDPGQSADDIMKILAERRGRSY
jgi:hypothetical protein